MATKVKIDQVDRQICALFKGSTQSLPNSALTIITFTSAGDEVYNPNGWHSTSSNPTRITAPVAGIYEVKAQIRFNDSTLGSSRGTQLLVNNAAVVSAFTAKDSTGTGRGAVNLLHIMSLAANDYLEIQGYQDTGGALNTLSVYFSVERIA